MVTIYGMNPKIGNISFYDSKQSEYQFNKPYSEATAELIDQEAKKIVDHAYKHAKELLTAKKKELEVVAKELLEKEIIFQSDLEELIGKRPFEHHTTYEEFAKRVEEKEKNAREKAKKEDEKIALNKPENGKNDHSTKTEADINGNDEVKDTTVSEKQPAKEADKSVKEN